METPDVIQRLNVLYSNEYYPYSEIESVERIELIDDLPENRFYAIHPKNNVISLFPPLNSIFFKE